jgi:hypothetical protein
VSNVPYQPSTPHVPGLASLVLFFFFFFPLTFFPDPASEPPSTPATSAVPFEFRFAFFFLAVTNSVTGEMSIAEAQLQN